MKRRIGYVDFLRVIASFMVIGTHLKLSVAESPSISRIAIACFVSDGVAIFWLIMGMFYFKEMPYKQRLKKWQKKLFFLYF